jgi:hypothetical protein
MAGSGNDFDSDAMLAFFGQLGKEIDAFKVKVVSLNEAGDAMKKMTDHTEKFGQTIQRHTRSTFRGMEGSVGNLIGMVGGAGGLALTFAGAAKALDQFAVGELRMRNFATNTGFSVEGVKNLRVQLSAAGMSASEAAQGIGNIGAKLQEVLALQETSPFYRALQASEPQMAEYVRHLMNAGKQQEALNYLQEKFNKGGERFKAWLPTVTGVSRAAWEAQKYGMEGLIPAWEFNQESAVKYHKTMVNLATIFDGVWTSMTYTVLEGLVKLTGSEGLEGLNAKAKKFAEDFKKYFDESVMPTLKETFEEVKGIIAWFENRGPQLQLKPEEFIRRQNEEKSFSSWDWLKGQLGVKTGGSDWKPLPRSGYDAASVVEISKDANRSVRDMRDLIQKWDDEQTGVGGGAGAGTGGAASVGGGGGSGEAAAGGPAGLNDENGKKIDAETMRQAEILGRAGDVAGLQRLFSQKGYHMSGPACGIVATGYVKSAGFKPPTGAAIASSWHGWGEKMDPSGINEPGRPFGSMVSTYFHGRYGGKQGQLLGPHEQGGHVMTVVPGTYNPKDNTAMFADQYGVRRRSLSDMDTRFAGASAVAAAEAAKAGNREKIDGALAFKPGGAGAGAANLRVDFNNVPPGVKTNADMDGGIFKTLKMNRNNQMAYE